ncbi:MAG: (Fe-S)-binding protein [Nitrospirae bacterium]|nr:(Fe-S)-binding protein [Nitrospirota bacterium]MBF0540588.1 (Fe-S)-binding protein [Nitrospirota bacterium]
MNKDQYEKSLLTCVRCGICKASCPVFNNSNLEPDSPRGRMRLLWAFTNGHIKYSERLYKTIFGCLLCGECTRSCNPGIDLNEVFYYARAELSKYNKKTDLYNIFSNFAFNHTDLLINAYTPISVLLINPIKKFFINKFYNKGLIPKNIDINSKPFRNVKIFHPKNKIGRVALFLGCSSKHLYPQHVTAICSILTAINYEVVISPAEVCCGAPFRTLGLDSQVVHCAKQNYETFKNLNVDAVLSLCPTCVDTLKNYPTLIGESIEDVYDVNEFIFERFLRDDIVKQILPFKAVYHEPCHMVNKTSRNRKILKRIVSELVEPEKRKCCGFGGTFSILNPQISNNILTDASVELYKTDANAVVTACPGCVFQLSKKINDIPVYHIVELMYMAINHEGSAR